MSTEKTPTRDDLVRRMRGLLEDINQLFAQAKWFNENRVEVGEPLIDPDPDGVLAKIKKSLELTLAREAKITEGKTA